MHPPRTSELRATGRDVRDALIGLVPTGLALLVAAAVLDGLSISPWWTAFVVAAVLAAADALTRPALRELAGRVGAIAALVLGVVVGMERRASGGILAPVLTHLVWSVTMLYALPAIL